MSYDPFRNYDSWKLRSPDDEAEDRERELEREQDLEDSADERNEERAERRRMAAEAEDIFDATEWDELGATDIIHEDELIHPPEKTSDE